MVWREICIDLHGPLTRYVKLQVAHAPGMPGTFSLAADFKGNRWLAIPACITARAWRTCRDACRDRLPAVTGKTFPAFPAHAHPQICVSGKRPMHTHPYSYSWNFAHRYILFACVWHRRLDAITLGTNVIIQFCSKILNACRLKVSRCRP